MKVPSIFVPEKDLEKKIFQLTEKSSDKKTSQPEGSITRKQKIDAGQCYWKFVNIAIRGESKELTLENIKNCLKDLTDEEASEVFNYGRREKERYLEYLMYR